MTAGVVTGVEGVFSLGKGIFGAGEAFAGDGALVAGGEGTAEANGIANETKTIGKSLENDNPLALHPDSEAGFPDPEAPSCFVAGTEVLLGNGKTEEDIQDIRVGQRVATDGGVANSANGKTKSPDPNSTQVDPRTWRLVTIKAGDWNVETLEPITWIYAQHLSRGQLLPLSDVTDVAEMGVPDGLIGTVESISACPAIQGGPGRVVLTTVNHLNDDVYELTLTKGRESDLIGVTGYHKIYTEDRGWVDASDLALGEKVRGAHGDLTVASLVRDPGTYRVYNMTVEADHVYYVGDLDALVHNDCPLIVDNNLSPKVAEGLRAAGYDAIHVQELFGTDPGDAAIQEAARELEAKVLTSNIKDFPYQVRVPSGLSSNGQLQYILRFIFGQ